MEILLLLALFALLSRPTAPFIPQNIAALSPNVSAPPFSSSYYPSTLTPGLTPTVAVSQLPSNIAIPASVAAFRATPPLPVQLATKYRATPPSPELVARAGVRHF